MEGKQTILRLTKKKKSFRKVAEMLGEAKSRVWYILRKRHSSDELRNVKSPGHP